MTKIFIGTPCYGGMIAADYFKSCMRLVALAATKKIELQFATIGNESLITRARNTLVQLFMDGDYTHLLFIDADLAFDPQAVIRMLDFDKDIISVPYPMKTMSWDKIWRRLKSKEGAVNDANDLAKAGFTFPVKVQDPNSITVEKGLMELTHAPTGCMLIKRRVFKKMIEEFPHLEIFQPTNINGKEEKKDNMYNLFDTLHDPKTKRYFGEDFGFCQRWSDIGGKVYAYIDDYITHVGEYSYCGKFKDDLWQATRPVKPVDDTTKIK